MDRGERPGYRELPTEGLARERSHQGGQLHLGLLLEAIKAWDGAEFRWGEFVDLGPASDTIVVNQTAELTGKTSGAEVLWSYWVVFTFRDGRVVRSKWFPDRDEALEAAGLSE